MRRRMKPCMTTWPDIVPTDEDAKPESRVRSRTRSPRCWRQGLEAVEGAVDVLDVVRPLPWNSPAAISIIDMFTMPGERHRDHHVDLLEAQDAPPLAVVATDHAALRERRVEIHDVRHHGRAEDPGREQDALGAVEAGDEQVLRDLSAVGIGLKDLERERGTTTPTMPAITASSRRKPRCCRARIPNAPAPAITGCGEQRDSEQQVEPERGADDLGEVRRHRDVSAWIHRPIEVRR